MLFGQGKGKAALLEDYTKIYAERSHYIAHSGCDWVVKKRCKMANTFTYLKYGECTVTYKRE